MVGVEKEEGGWGKRGTAGSPVEPFCSFFQEKRRKKEVMTRYGKRWRAMNITFLSPLFTQQEILLFGFFFFPLSWDMKYGEK